MYHIAIVEDEKDFSDQLQTFLQQYQKEQRSISLCGKNGKSLNSS